MDVRFREFSLLYQIFFSSQTCVHGRVQQSLIISNKHGIYELPDELWKELRLTILGK